jgi:hypothetical protein
MDKKELAFELEMAMAAQSWCMVRKVIATLKSEDALRESEELRRDAERLNWLQDNPEHESVPYPEDGRWHVPYMVRSHGDVGSGVGLRTYETLRAAIDSARGVG